MEVQFRAGGPCGFWIAAGDNTEAAAAITYAPPPSRASRCLSAMSHPTYTPTRHLLPTAPLPYSLPRSLRRTGSDFDRSRCTSHCRSLKCHPDNQRVLVTSRDNSVRMFEIKRYGQTQPKGRSLHFLAMARQQQRWPSAVVRSTGCGHARPHTCARTARHCPAAGIGYLSHAAR